MNFRFYRLIFCQCAAALANAALRFALSLHLLRVTGSAALYGSITALAMLPMLAGAFGGGFLADRFCKHRLLAALDGITAALIAVSASLCALRLQSRPHPCILDTNTPCTKEPYYA